MVNLIKDEVKDDYRIMEYDNGTVIKELITKGTVEEKVVTIPPSPLEILKKENQLLKLTIAEQSERYDQEILKLKIAIAEQSEGGVK